MGEKSGVEVKPKLSVSSGLEGKVVGLKSEIISRGENRHSEVKMR